MNLKERVASEVPKIQYPFEKATLLKLTVINQGRKRMGEPDAEEVGLLVANMS